MDEKSPKSMKRRISFKAMVVWLVVLLAVAAAVFFYIKYQDARSQLPEEVAAQNAEETSRVIGKLGNILSITTDAQPTVARVDDPDVLKQANPDFYADAQAGDYLILYPERAIIYRESENKIINIAPIINTSNIKPNTDQSTSTDQSSDTTNTGQ